MIKENFGNKNFSFETDSKRGVLNLINELEIKLHKTANKATFK